MKLLYLNALCIILSWATYGFSQEINYGPRITALGNTGVALSDIWSLQANQAGLAGLKKPVASISYRNSFLNPELNTQSAVLAYPKGRNVIGLSLHNYGFSAYSEQKLGFTYAKMFGPALSAAINVNLHQVKIQQYGSAQTYSVEAGLQYKLNENLTLGTHISNPFANGYTNEVDAVIPVSMEFGASYRFTDKLLLNTGVVNNLSSSFDIRGGLEYFVINSLAFRGGIAARPFRQFAGFGYQLYDFKFDAAASSHPVLGISPQLALSYEF